MLGRRKLVAAVCLVAMHMALSAYAQEDTSRRPTLTERLQRFRQDLLGDSGRESRPRAAQNQASGPARASTKSMGNNRPTMVAPPAPQTVGNEAPPFTQPQVGSAATAAPSPNPSRMQIQSARRAQNGTPPVTVITPGTPTPADSRLVQPVQEARRPSFLDDTADENSVEEINESEPFDDEDAPSKAGEPTLAEEPMTDDLMEDTRPSGFAPATPYQPERNRLRPALVDPESQVVDEIEEASELAEPLEPTPQELEPAPQGDFEPPYANEDDDTSRENVLFTAQSPVLSVAASGPRTVMIGKEAEFVVHLTNSGAAANNVVVKIIIPNYADVAACRSSAGTAQPPSRGEINCGLEWTIERLEAGAEETLTLKLIPRKSSPLDLAISYTFTPETSQTMVEVQEPKLAMNISGPSEVLFGQTKVYKLTISNPGNGDTHNVSVALLPIGRGGEAQGSHRLGTLRAGESKTIDIELTARQAGAIAIKAQSFADGGLRAEASQDVLVRRADLHVAIEAPNVKYAGTPATYQIVVQNKGDALADRVELSAMLPPESRFLSASGGRLDPQQGRVTWTVGTLPAGGERVFELQCALNAPGESRLQVAVDGGGELTASAVAATRVEAIADLKLEVRDPQGPVAVGEDAIYEVRIRNRGTKAAHGVDLAVFFSEGLEPTAADGGQYDLGAGQVLFRPLTSIAAGESAVFHIRARADQPGNHVFRAEVNCPSLDTKLAAEEATHFYGDNRVANVARREPTLAKPPRNDEPTAQQDDLPPGNRYE